MNTYDNPSALDSTVNDLITLYSTRVITPSQIIPLINDGVNLVKMRNLTGLEKKQAILTALDKLIIRLPDKDQEMAHVLIKELCPIAIDTLVMAYKRLPEIKKQCGCFGKKNRIVK